MLQVPDVMWLRRSAAEWLLCLVEAVVHSCAASAWCSGEEESFRSELHLYRARQQGVDVIGLGKAFVYFLSEDSAGALCPVPINPASPHPMCPWPS